MPTRIGFEHRTADGNGNTRRLDQRYRYRIAQRANHARADETRAQRLLEGFN